MSVLMHYNGDSMSKLLFRQLSLPSHATIALLPSPYAVIIRTSESSATIFGPHQHVFQTPGVGGEAIFCTPNFVKALLGHPRYFINRHFTSAELSLLRPFDEHSFVKWPDLVNDVRDSVQKTPDEVQFEREWPRILAGEPMHVDATQQRQLERLCLRYAGQSPLQIMQEVRLSRQLAADIARGEHVSLGLFADQSHYIRECKKLTGQTPQYWQNLSATFYGYDGELATMKL